MAKVDMKEIVGETFEDMSIAEMTMVQGSGDVGAEFTTSPACVALSIASSVKCAGAVSAIASAVTGLTVSIAKC